MDHRLKSIYDALDSGNYKLGLNLCNKWLKKAPDSPLLLVLRAYALDKIGNLKESMEICDSLLEEKILDEGITSTLLMIFRNQARHESSVILTKYVYEAAPWNEEYGRNWALATVRARDFKQTQVIAMALYRKFKKDQYMYWYIMSLVLQVENNDPNSLMLLTLGEKMMDKNIESGKLKTFEELDLFIQILEKQDKWGKLKNSLMLSQVRDLIKVEKDLKSLNIRVEMRLKDYNQALSDSANLLQEFVDDWKFYETFVTCLFEMFTTPAEILDHGLKVIRRAQTMESNSKSVVRGPFLAEMYLYQQLLLKMEYRQNEHFLDLILKYTDLFGVLPIYFNDIKPFLAYFENCFTDLIEQLQKKVTTDLSITSIRKHINIQKITYYFSGSKSFEDQKHMISGWIEMYKKSLSLGLDLDEREMQYGDDYILLASLLLLKEYSMDRGKKHLLFSCLLILEYALEKSKFNFYFKIVMVRIYLELNAYSRAAELYESLDIKQIQHESLSYLITDFCHMTGFYSKARDILLSAQSIYSNNMRETPEMMVQAFKFGTYSKISEFHQFFLQIDQSLNRQILRSQLIMNDLIYRCNSWNDTCQLLDNVDEEFIQSNVTLLKKNRDFSVIPHFAQDSDPSLLELIHGDSDLESAGILDFTKLYCKILMSWRSKDESKIKAALNDLKNLELSQIKASDKSTIEIMIFFTEILISVHSEENIKFDLILNFVNQKKHISIIRNIFDSRDIYSKLQSLQTISTAIQVLSDDSQKNLKEQYAELNKSVRQFQRSMLENITQKMEILKNSSLTADTVLFSDLFDTLIVGNDRIKERILINFENSWFKSLSEIQSSLHSKINKLAS